MTTFADRYAAGVKAFAVLTGELDKQSLKDAVRDGFAALLEWSEKTSGREISKTSGRSVNQVARDIRAARFMADHPKADPVATVKACNVLTAAQVAKADGPKALAEAFRKQSGETAKGRKARGQADQVEKTGKAAAKAVKGQQRPMTPQDVVALMRSGRLLPANGWDANGYDLICTEAAIQRDALRKAAQAVAKTA